MYRFCCNCNSKGQCSMFGANKTATAAGGTLQLRALDWDIDGPFKNYPQVTIYHPNKGNGHTFANVGWTGWIGSITGMSSVQMAISEIGVSFPDDTFGHESRFGVPFTYLLRDILQFDNTLTDSMTRMTNAHRTCNLILGVGDGKMDSFRGVEYSASVANYFTPENLQPTADWHPRIPGIVYWGMDWLCPGYSSVLAKQLDNYHGQLTPDVTIHDILPVVQSGDLHIAVYDLQNELMYVSNARADKETGPDMAYDRPFVELDMKTLFNEAPPTP
ncbi:protein dcd1B-like isoform X4 [Dysidea avara]|uniref:protein dcd1B-like isoform X4 n=1 Tax=Dysidea avara TaxID=196820 RepID=UPI00332E4E17